MLPIRILSTTLAASIAFGTAFSAMTTEAAAFEIGPDGRKILVWGGRTPISNFDPHQRFDAPHHVFQSAIYEPLVKYRGSPSEIVPWLAESWESNEDATVWTFKLDPRAKFQNGDPVDAEAVRFSFLRALEINKAVAWMLSGTLSADAIEVVDASTIRFTFEIPSPSFIGYLPWWMIVNPAVVTANEADGDNAEVWMTTNTAGSGPFRVKNFRADAVYQLEAVEDYWRGWEQGEDKRLGGVIYQVVREPSAQRTALMTRQVDIVEGLTTADYQQVANAPGIVIQNNPGISPFAIKFNYQEGPTSDINLRRAIAYAFDYEALPSLYAGDATLLSSPFPAAVQGAIEVEDFPRRDLEKAREYLAKTEWANGGLELEYVHQQGNDETRRVGLILLDSLRELGISVRITPLLWANMVANAQNVETAANMTGLFTATYTSDPDSAASQYHRSAWGQWFGVSHYDNPEVFALIEKGRTTASWDERAPIYAEIQSRIVADQPEVFGYAPNVRIAHRDYVKGYEYTAIKTSGFVDFGTLWIEQ